MAARYRDGEARAGRAIVLGLALLGMAWGAEPVRAQQVDPLRLAALMTKIDASGLQPLGEVSLPPGAVSRDAMAGLNPGTAGPAMTGEPFGPLGGSPRRGVSESANFLYEWLAARGSVLLYQKQESSRSQPIAGGAPALRADARAKLAALGIGPEEIGNVQLRQLMAQGHDGQRPADPRIVSHKVFVERAIGGVPVLGSRSVATYGSDRSFRKLMVHWPGLAQSGHVLTTALTAEQIAQNVARTLVERGQDDLTGSVPLQWVYTAIPVGPAEVRLELRVEATLLDTPRLDEVEPSSGHKVRVRLFEPGGAGEIDRDVDRDGIPNTADNCPFWSSPDQSDTDGDGRGNPCECGDQSGDGRNTVADIIAINIAVFTPALVTDLCDANYDERCDVRDMIAVNLDLFSPTSDTICSRQPIPSP